MGAAGVDAVETSYPLDALIDRGDAEVPPGRALDEERQDALAPRSPE
jgi:hypothetical protein